MFSLLDLVNSYLGYFTTNSRTKGRIYTLVGSVGVWYLLYLAVRFFQNGRWLRGSLIVAVFLLLLYFCVLNIFYYFTDKAIKWDISRYMVKIFGTTVPTEDSGTHPVIMPANGLYARKDVLKAEITTNEAQQERIDHLAKQLLDMGMWPQDYHHLGKQAQRQIVAQEGAIHANHPGTLLPYFDLANGADGQLNIVAGLNQLEAENIATITRVGLLPVADAQDQYELSLSSVIITGGKSQVQGRKGLVETMKPYYIRAEVAYAKRN